MESMTTEDSTLLAQYGVYNNEETLDPGWTFYLWNDIDCKDMKPDASGALIKALPEGVTFDGKGYVLHNLMLDFEHIGPSSGLVGLIGDSRRMVEKPALGFRDSEKHGCGYPFRLYRRAYFERSDFRLYSTRGEDDVSRRRGWCVGRGDEWEAIWPAASSTAWYRPRRCRTKRVGLQEDSQWSGRQDASDFKGTVANDIINRVFITD